MFLSDQRNYISFFAEEDQTCSFCFISACGIAATSFWCIPALTICRTPSEEAAATFPRMRADSRKRSGSEESMSFPRVGTAPSPTARVTGASDSTAIIFRSSCARLPLRAGGVFGLPRSERTDLSFSGFFYCDRGALYKEIGGVFGL